MLPYTVGHSIRICRAMDDTAFPALWSYWRTTRALRSACLTRHRPTHSRVKGVCPTLLTPQLGSVHSFDRLTTPSTRLCAPSFATLRGNPHSGYSRRALLDFRSSSGFRARVVVVSNAVDIAVPEG